MRWNASRASATVATPSSVRLPPSATTWTALPVSRWISSIRPEISAAAACEPSASLRTSSATTAKPLPCSPARAASMAALSASRLVCSARPVIVSTMPPIFSERADSSWIAVETSWEDIATWRIASEAELAASTPCSATARASSAALAVSSAVWAETPAARAASAADERADSTMRTCFSAPCATSETAEAISLDRARRLVGGAGPSAARRPRRVPAEIETWPSVSPSFVRIAL